MEDEIRCEVNKWRRLKRERPGRIDVLGDLSGAVDSWCKLLN